MAKPKAPIQSVPHPDTVPGPESAETPLEVVAIAPGFYGQYREIGDRFILTSPDRDFSEKWMVPYEGDPLEVVPTGEPVSSGKNTSANVL